MANHTVGVPTWREKLPKGAAYNWDEMVSRCEAEAPFWEPGTRHGYHMLSFGWLVGELVRRVSGQSLGTFLRQAICIPSGADFWLGLPESEEHRVAPVIPAVPDPAAPSAFTRAIRADRQGIPALALLNQGGFDPNSRAAHAAEIGGGGGLSSGRGLAHLYRRFAVASDTGARTGAVSADAIGRMSTVAAANEADATLGLATRFSLGFMMSMDNRRRPEGFDRESVIVGPSAFGHVGAGGSIGFADPDVGLSFGYAMNRLGEGILLNERGQALVDATYLSLGYRSDASGTWRR
jgi:CubicO group peptidase (beta-lactamase class C family)